MIEKLDEALTELVNTTIAEIDKAKKAGHWSRDFVEGVCIVLSMAYGRYGHGDQQPHNSARY